MAARERLIRSAGRTIRPYGYRSEVENGIVYTIEGNSDDSVRLRQYAVGHYELLGYGIPQY